MSLAPRALIAVLICSSVAAFPLPASADTSIGTQPSANQTCGWGYGDAKTATFGQSIVVPTSDNVLERFSFYLTQDGAPATITYKAYVYEWDGTKAVAVDGTSVWESPEPQTVATVPATQQVTIETGGVALQSGQPYVIFLSVSETYGLNTDGDVACWINARQVGTDDPYPDGEWVFLNNHEFEELWTTEAWGFGDDIQFNATFSSPGGGTIYEFDGFYTPVDNKDTQGNYILNQVRAGAAIPVRFSLGGDFGLDVFEAGYPRSQVILCDSQAEVDGIEQTVIAGGSSLSYNAATDTYTYIWKTDRTWAEGCRQLVVKFDDGTTARANFSFTS